MPAPRLSIQTLHEARSRLQADIDALQSRLAGLEMAIELLEAECGSTKPKQYRERAKRGNVKATLLDILKEVGPTGLNALVAVDLASRRGVTLDRGTVSSLLSRLKADGAVDYDGDRYRLKSAIVASNGNHPTH